jgi:hypothetical protein
MTAEKQKKERDNPTPPVANVPKCTDFSAAMGTEVNFTGITGPCTISPGNTPWPFTLGPNIVFPLVGNTKIYILSSLTVGNSYQYVVSCCSSDTAPHTVTVTS